MRLSGYRYFLNLYWAARVHLFLNRVGVPAIGYSNTPSSFGFRVFFFFCRFCRLMELAKLSFIRRRSRFSYRRRGVFRWRRHASGFKQNSMAGITVRVTCNNLFMVIYSTSGKILFWISRGRKGFNFQLYTKINIHLIGYMFAELLKTIPLFLSPMEEVGYIIPRFTVRGRAPVGLMLKSLKSSNCHARIVRVGHLLPHNGCRLPCRRRGARN